MGVEAILLRYLVVIFTLISGVELIAEIFPQEPNSDALSVRQRCDRNLIQRVLRLEVSTIEVKRSYRLSNVR